MAVFTDELYQTMVPDDFTVTVPDPIFVGITLEEGDALVLQTHSCWATPTPDPENTLQYTFIDDFCSTEEDGTILIKENGRRPMAQFSIAAFSFVDADSQIFLHCNVRTTKKIFVFLKISLSTINFTVALKSNINFIYYPIWIHGLILAMDVQQLLPPIQTEIIGPRLRSRARRLCSKLCCPSTKKTLHRFFLDIHENWTYTHFKPLILAFSA